MAKDMRERRAKENNSGALMGALGVAMTAGSSWYDKQQQEKAKALREAEMMKLKRGELELGQKKLDASNALGQEKNRIAEMQVNNQADQIAGIQSRYDNTEKKQQVGTFLTNDFEKWKQNYVGTSEDAKLRAKAWGTVLEQGLESYSDEDLETVAARINEQFGTGASGKPLLSAAEITDGIGQLRTYAKMRGLSPEDVTDDDIRSLLSSSFSMGAEEQDPMAGGEAPLMGDPSVAEEGPSGPRFGGVSKALFGEEGEDWLEQANENMWNPLFDKYSGYSDMYQKYMGQPFEQAVKWGAKGLMGIED